MSKWANITTSPLPEPNVWLRSVAALVLGIVVQLLGAYVLYMFFGR